MGLSEHRRLQSKARGDVMERSQIGILLTKILLLFCTLSCSNQERSPSVAAVPKSTNPSEWKATEPTAKGTVADTLGSDLILPEDISSEVKRDATPGPLILPTSFGRRTGDFDQMLRERKIRALVGINPLSFFYSHGKPKGITYEMLEQLQRVANKKFKTVTSKLNVTFIPLRPDELGPALTQGVGDVIAEGVWITPQRQESYA